MFSHMHRDVSEVSELISEDIEHYNINIDDKNSHLVTVGVLLQCSNPRFIFCCAEFVDVSWESSLSYEADGPGVGFAFVNGMSIVDKNQLHFRGYASSCQLLNPLDLFYLTP